MRNSLVLILASTVLTACGGAGANSVGSNAPASAGNDPVVPGSGHTFVAPTEAKTYSAIGGVQNFNYKTSDHANAPKPGQQYGQLYGGSASTARNSGITVSYNPRDATFDIVMKDESTNIELQHRFQDPLHRTDFGGAKQPQGGVPNLTPDGVQYLQGGGTTGVVRFNADNPTFPVDQVDGARNVITFFYQKPGTVTKYVTYAGYVRNKTSIMQIDPPSSPGYDENQNELTRAAFVYGERTAANDVPKLGSATYTGPMIASMVYNPLPELQGEAPTYFQWMEGSAETKINFATNLFDVSFAGRVQAPLLDVYTSQQYVLRENAIFAGKGSGRIDLVLSGGFLGQMKEASFTQPDGTILPLNIIGSSVDGAFFGPVANEVGGGFRIVGGTPDERVDIMGAFTGKQ